jgi:WD40 repeat protein
MRVTSNTSDAPIQSMAISPDGKYLAYSDINGVHVRSLQTEDNRLLSDTKGMFVQYWAADATQFFLGRFAGEQYGSYSVSLPGGVPRRLGNALPSPGGEYSLTFSNNHAEIRRSADGKVYSFDRKDASMNNTAWSSHDKRLAAVFAKPGRSPAFWIEAFSTENGHWTPLLAPIAEYISDVAWLSEGELVYAKFEPAPRTDSNLWVLNIDAATGRPSGVPTPRTRWSDFSIQGLSGSENGNRLSFVRTSLRSNVYVAELSARGTHLGPLRQLTTEEAQSSPLDWTPDSKTVLLESNRDGQFRMYKQDIDKERADLITSGPGNQSQCRVSPDGRWVLYILEESAPARPRKRLMRIPLAGGSAEEILRSDDVEVLNCSHTPGGACVFSEFQGKARIGSLFDPEHGRGPKVLEITGNGAGPVISPNGQHIAFVLPETPHNRIRIVDLHGATERQITVAGAEDLPTLDWSADGASFFSGDIQSNGTRLLHIERNGSSQVLWTQTERVYVWGIPSPDGRYLATFKTDLTANVWMVENP